MNPLTILKDLFPKEPITLEMQAMLPEVIQTLDEREQCILKKYMTGMPFKEIGKIIMNHRTHCGGLTEKSTRDFYWGALRKMKTRSRQCIWNMEKDCVTWLKERK